MYIRYNFIFCVDWYFCSFQHTLCIPKTAHTGLIHCFTEDSFSFLQGSLWPMNAKFVTCSFFFCLFWMLNYGYILSIVIKKSSWVLIQGLLLFLHNDKDDPEIFEAHQIFVIKDYQDKEYSTYFRYLWIITLKLCNFVPFGHF